MQISARSATVGLQSLRITSKRCMPVASQVKMGYGCLWQVYYILLHHVWTIFGVFWATWKEQLPTWRQKKSRRSIFGRRRFSPWESTDTFWSCGSTRRCIHPDLTVSLGTICSVWSFRWCHPILTCYKDQTSTISHNVWSVYVDSF